MSFLSPLYRIYVADTDEAGVVHHANYLKYFEAGRIEYLRSLGMPYVHLQRQGMGFVPVTIDLTYKHPLRQDDCYHVTVDVQELKGASVVMRQSIVWDDQVFVTACVRLACVQEPAFKPVRIPKDWFRCFAAALESKR